MKPSTPSRSRPVGQRIPAGQLIRVRLGEAQVRRRHLHQRGHAVRVGKRVGEGRRGAHRGADQHHAVQLALVEHGLEVRDQIRVLVCAGVRCGVGVTMAARVVGQHAMAGALQSA